MSSDYEKSAFVYLDSLLDNKEPIYVRNSYVKRGIIVVTLNDGNRSHREAIPNTKFPICLSAKATPDMIRNSKSLRSLLDKGALSLVSKDTAEKELSKAGVREALAEAYERIGFGSSAVKKLRQRPDDEEVIVSTSANIPMMANGEERPFDPDNIEDDDSESSGDDAQIRVQTLVESLTNRDMKARQVKADLMSMDLTEVDLAYLVSNTSGIVQRYAKEKFAELNGTHFESDDSDDE